MRNGPQMAPQMVRPAVGGPHPFVSQTSAMRHTMTALRSTSASGAPDNSSLSHFSAMTRPTWLGRAARNRHRHAIEQASRRWRGGRRDDSARTRRRCSSELGTHIWFRFRQNGRDRHRDEERAEDARRRSPVDCASCNPPQGVISTVATASRCRSCSRAPSRCSRSPRRRRSTRWRDRKNCQDGPRAEHGRVRHVIGDGVEHRGAVDDAHADGPFDAPASQRHHHVCGSFSSTHGLLAGGRGPAGSLFPCCMAGCSSSLSSSFCIRLPICSDLAPAVSPWGLEAAGSLLCGRGPVGLCVGTLLLCCCPLFQLFS